MIPGDDFRGAAISDLGASPGTALPFNTPLVPVGVPTLAAGSPFHPPPERRLLAALTLAGVGAVGAGLFRLDTGGLHGLTALLASPFFNVQAPGTATRLRSAMRALSVLAGGVGLVFVVLMTLGGAGNAAAFGPIGHGGTERTIASPAVLRPVAPGGYLPRRAMGRTSPLSTPREPSMRPFGRTRSAAARAPHVYPPLRAFTKRNARLTTISTRSPT